MFVTSRHTRQATKHGDLDCPFNLSRIPKKMTDLPADALPVSRSQSLSLPIPKYPCGSMLLPPLAPSSQEFSVWGHRLHARHLRRLRKILPLRPERGGEEIRGDTGEETRQNKTRGEETIYKSGAGSIGQALPTPHHSSCQRNTQPATRPAACCQQPLVHGGILCFDFTSLSIVDVECTGRPRFTLATNMRVWGVRALSVRQAVHSGGKRTGSGV